MCSISVSQENSHPSTIFLHMTQALKCSPGPLATKWGPTSKGGDKKEGNGGERREGRKWKAREEKGGGSGGKEKGGKEKEKEGKEGQPPRSTDPGYGHDKGSVLNARPYFQPLITRILHCIAIVNKY